MTWGDVASTPLVLGSGSAVDGRSGADWEPMQRPTSLLSAGIDGDDEASSSTPSFDVIDERGSDRLARRAEKGLLDRARTYRAAATCDGGKSKKSKEADDDSSSVVSSRSKSTITSTMSLDRRKASLTPAAQALLEASNSVHQSKRKNSKSRSSIFQSSKAGMSSANGRLNAGSRDSFGSALRASYTPSATPRGISGSGSKKRKSSSSL